MRRALLTWTIALALAGLAAPAGAQEAATGEAKEPRLVEAVTPVAPMRMLVEDARILFLRLEEQRREAAGGADAAATSAADEEGQGVCRTFEVETPPVTNGSDRFEFRDVTDRTVATPLAAPAQAVSLPERRAAVEEYRRAVAKAKSKAR